MYSSLLDLKLKDIISIVGAGGKTTLMLALAKERQNSKVLITSTTKIFLPDKGQYDYLYIAKKPIVEKTGIYIYGNHIEHNKIAGSKAEFYKDFDFVFVEADGASGKLLKGWNENEPVIAEGTTKTIGILSFAIIGMEINETNVHRPQHYSQITGTQLGEKITIQQLVRLTLNENGLFKNSSGERILFVNLKGNAQTEQLKLIVPDIKPAVDKIIGFDIERGVGFEM